MEDRYVNEQSIGMKLEEKLQELNSTVVEIDQDGHCLINAVAETLRHNYRLTLSKLELFNALKHELMTYISEYKNFQIVPELKLLNSVSSQLITDLDRLFTHGVYETDTVDLVIPALCNSLNMTVIIYQQGTDGKLIEIRQTPFRDGIHSKYVIYLQRIHISQGAEHYNAIVSRSVESMNKRSPIAAKKRKVYVQGSISQMFSSSKKLKATKTEAGCSQPSTNRSSTEGGSNVSLQSTNPSSFLDCSAGYQSQSTNPSSSLDCSAGYQSQSTNPSSSLDCSAGYQSQSTNPSSSLDCSAGYKLKSGSTDAASDSNLCSTHVTHLISSDTATGASVGDNNLSPTITSDDVIDVHASLNDVKASCSIDENSNKSYSFPKVCRNYEQFKAWQNSRDWLKMSDSGSVVCKICSNVKHNLGVCVSKRQRIDNAFVDGTVTCNKDAKTLLKKIDKHRDSHAHVTACKIIADRKSESMKQSLSSSQSLFEEQHKSNIDITERLFRTAYECASSHLSFHEYSRLVDLQICNGLECGQMLYSHQSCSDIIEHIAHDMTKEIVQHIIQAESKISIMIDESTDVSNVQNLIVYVRTNIQGKVHVYFLGLIPLVVATAAAIHDKLQSFLSDIGLTKDILSRQLIGFCSDGASCMIGQFQGVATLLRNDFPKLRAFHCMAHRLELAVKNAVDSVNYISHFRDFMDCVYKVYSMSPKNQRELEVVAGTLSVKLLKIKKVFDIRWVFSSHLSVKAVWQDFPALHQHFLESSQDQSRNVKERSKCLGLVNKIKSWFFLAELAMLNDALFVLVQLSLYFQSDSVSVRSAKLHIDTAKEKFAGLKNSNGSYLTEFFNSFDNDGIFKGVCILKKTNDDDKFQQTKCQFYQALFDNIEQRFPFCVVLKDALVLNAATWPNDQLELALHGDREVVNLCKEMDLCTDTTMTVLQEFTEYKKTLKMGEKLQYLVHSIETLPLSTAACERGFSAMNQAHTDIRNRLSSASVSSLLMLNINGPRLSDFNARKYVITWLRKGRHGGMDHPTGRSKRSHETSEASKIFM